LTIPPITLLPAGYDSRKVCPRWGGLVAPNDDKILREHAEPLSTRDVMGSKLGLIIFLTVEQSMQDYIAIWQSVCSCQRTFLIEGIRRYVGKLFKIVSEFLCFELQILRLRDPNFLTQFLKLHSITCGNVCWLSAEGSPTKEEINFSGKT